MFSAVSSAFSQPWDASAADSVMVASSRLSNGPSVMPYTPPGVFPVAYPVSLGWPFVGFGWKYVDSNVSAKPSNVKGKDHVKAHHNKRFTVRSISHGRLVTKDGLTKDCML